MELIHNIDFWLFEFINNDLSNAFFDWIMPIFRDKKTWIPLYILLFVFIVYKFKKRAWIVILLAIISIGMADGISSHILKPLVERLRPCNVSAIAHEIHLRIHCSGGFSFPSSHAANHFALGSFIGLVFREQYKWIFYTGLIWAATISFAQVYVGVHFPIDVIFGAILGLSIGFFLYNVPYKYLMGKF